MNTFLHNLHQLIEEFQVILQSIDTSGQPNIQNHFREVHTKLVSIISDNPSVLQKEPEQKPVCKYLDAVRCGDNLYSGICRFFNALIPALQWEYGYTSMPEQLYDMYGYTEIIGPNGNFYREDLATGFVLLAPGCLYPDHDHQGIEESYFCLSGRITQNDNEELSPGGYLFNPPGKTHRLTVSRDAPGLLAYIWNAEPHILKNNTMEF